MEKLVNVIISKQLRNPFLYALLIALLGLFYTGNIKEAGLTLVFLLFYAAFTSFLIHLTIAKLKGLGKELESNQFIQKIEIALTIISVILTLVFIGINLLVFKNLMIEILPTALVLLTATMPRNIQIASDFFLVKITELKDIDSKAAFVDTVIVEDDDVVSKNIELKHIFADMRIYSPNYFDIEDKMVKLTALSMDAKSELDRAVISTYNIDLKKIKETYKELAKPSKEKENSIYFYEMEEKGLAILKGETEGVLEKCDFIEEEGKIKLLSFGNKRELSKQVNAFLSSNFKVIAIAYKETKAKKLENKGDRFVFLAFLVFGFSPRKEFNELVKSCKESEIKVIYISKERTEVARYLAIDAMLITEEQEIINWNNITDQELMERLKETPVIAGAGVGAKKRIVELLEKNKAIIQKDNLDNFLENSKQIRSYFFNLANYNRYHLIFGFSLFFMLIANLFIPKIVPAFQLNWAIFFMFLFYFPSIALAFEQDAIKKTKLNLNRLYGANLFLALFLSVIVAALIAYVFTTYGISAAFFAFIAMHGFNLLNTNSMKKSFIALIKSNRLLLAAFLLIMIVLFAIYKYPQLQLFFGLSAISQNDFLLVLAISFGIVIVEEIRKLIIKF